MKNRYLILLTLCITYSCIEYNSHFSDEYRSQINKYQIGDTIHFENEIKNREVIRVNSIDSFSAKINGINNVPGKTMSLYIEHLSPKWDFPKILNKETGRYDSIPPQKFINIYKQQNSNNPIEDYYLYWVNYKDFSGEINFDKLNTNIIDTIISERKKDIYKLGNNSISEIYWHKYKGMVGYKKNNGSTYLLREN